jgi:hypothetical protein
MSEFQDKLTRFTEQIDRNHRSSSFDADYAFILPALIEQLKRVSVAEDEVLDYFKTESLHALIKISRIINEYRDDVFREVVRVIMGAKTNMKNLYLFIKYVKMFSEYNDMKANEIEAALAISRKYLIEIAHEEGNTSAMSKVRLECIGMIAAMAEYKFIPDDQIINYIHFCHRIIQENANSDDMITVYAVKAIGGFVVHVPPELIVDIVTRLLSNSTSKSETLRRFSLWGLSEFCKYKRLPKELIPSITAMMILKLDKRELSEQNFAILYLAHLVSLHQAYALEPVDLESILNTFVEDVHKKLNQTKTRSLVIKTSVVDCFKHAIDNNLCPRHFMSMRSMLIAMSMIGNRADGFVADDSFYAWQYQDWQRLHHQSDIDVSAKVDYLFSMIKSHDYIHPWLMADLSDLLYDTKLPADYDIDELFTWLSSQLTAEEGVVRINAARSLASLQPVITS